MATPFVYLLVHFFPEYHNNFSLSIIWQNIFILLIPDARHFQPVRPSPCRKFCLQNTGVRIGSFDHLAVSDIDADMSFLQNRNAGDLWHRRNCSFFFCLLKHSVCTDIGMSAASVLDSFRFRIQPQITFDEADAVCRAFSKVMFADEFLFRADFGMVLP